jgi:hypothetical protein
MLDWQQGYRLSDFVVATLLIADNSVDIEMAARSIIGKRSRGFHWTDEGSTIR